MMVGHECIIRISNRGGEGGGVVLLEIDGLSNVSPKVVVRTHWVFSF